jgi:TubC N-terminal docking domain
MPSMNADLLKRELETRGMRLSVDRGKLAVDFPKGVLDEATRRLIQDHKKALLETLHADDLREHFEERAAILEYDAGLPRPEAELEAARITATYARNCQYTWASLRAALAAYPELLAKLPETDGPVDALPLGVAKLAVLRDGHVLKRGVFASVRHER